MNSRTFQWLALSSAALLAASGCGGDVAVAGSPVDAAATSTDIAVAADTADAVAGDVVALPETSTAADVQDAAVAGSDAVEDVGTDAAAPDDADAAADAPADADIAADEVAATDADADAAAPVCAGGCDDKLPCTVDSCANGTCVHTAIPNCGAAPCGSGAACASGSYCASDLGACVQCVSSANCGSGQLCIDHACVAGTACLSDMACKAAGKICNLAGGFCVGCIKPADCGSGETCVAGNCEPVVPCVSSIGCPQVCDPVSGSCVACVASTDCDASAFCNAAHKCVPRVCMAPVCAVGLAFACTGDGAGFAPGVSCDDGNGCTADKCVDGVGCSHTPAAGSCDDGNPCTSGDTCALGACSPGGALNCDDGQACTADSCDASVGCVHLPSQPTCQDGNVCTINDTCTAKGCIGVPNPCKDKDDCTLDSCDVNAGCLHSPADGTPCNDGDFCTTGDTCVAGLCEGVTPTVCDDSDPCTLDFCDSKKGCLTAPGTGAVCNDGNACTASDKCSVGKCQGIAFTCADNNVCTSDSCDPVIGCTFTPIVTPCYDGDPCTVNDQCANGVCGGVPNVCNDNNPCTVDACVPGYGCQFNAGNNGAACTDANPCTVGETCSGGLCNGGVANTCDDGDKCTNDGCILNLGCVHPPQTPSECVDNDPCTLDSCSKNTCVHAPGCCKIDADCKDTDACTVDTCLGGKCAHTYSDAPGCCDTAPMWATFATDLSGFSVTASDANVAWSQQGVADATGGTGVLAFGSPTGATAIAPNAKATATSAPVALSPSSQTTLQYSFSAPSSSDFVQLQLVALVDGLVINIGSQMALMQTGWKVVSLDLTPFAGKTVQIQIQATVIFTSGSNTSPLQVYVDDVHIVATCKAKTCTGSLDCNPSYSMPCSLADCVSNTCSFINTCCTSNGDCNDGNLCTKDSCFGNKCAFGAITGCCLTAADCDDGNPCTTDGCPSAGGNCTHVALPGCCTASAQCNDSNACTVDYCLANACVHNGSCCSVDKDCSDGESVCTVDTCANGSCKHAFTGAKGCCNPMPYSAKFDTAAPTGISFVNSAVSMGWQVWQNSPQFVSGPGVLYYGDPAVKNYDDGGKINSGTATLPAIGLSADVTSTLSFQLYMDTETFATYDKLLVTVNGTVVWDKTDPKFLTKIWQSHAIDLSKWKGQSVTIQFKFDTVDSVANTGFGVAIDDLAVTAGCP